MTIYVDITELVNNPVRSGIQRIVREFIRRARPEDGYVCCFFHPTLNLMTIDDSAVEILRENDLVYKMASVEEIKGLVAEQMRLNPGEFLPYEGIKIFIPEVFYEINRVRHYRWRLQRTRDLYMLFCDFIPWLFPDKIGVKRGAPLMPYLQLSTEVPHAAFISETSRELWRTRVLRDQARSGCVLRLGSDGLKLEKQMFNSSRKTIVCLGSLDGRKNQDIIARAFARHFECGSDLRLVVMGYAFDKGSKLYKEVSKLAAECPNLEYIEAASDERVMFELRQSRATIYGSELEGFGLPPVESLFSGIPTIVSGQLPSIQRLATGGQIRIDKFDERSVVGAFNHVAEDQSASRLWNQAADLALPTWDDFVSDTRAWLADRASPI